MDDLTRFARERCFDVSWLQAQGFSALPRGGIGITYYDAAGNELFTRKRDVPRSGKRFINPTGGEMCPFGLHRLGDPGSKDVLCITEGETDTLALWTIGQRSIGIPGDTVVRRISLEDLGGADHLIVSLDNDPPAKKGAKRGCEVFRDGLLSHLPSIGFVGQMSFVQMPEGIKDVCELRQQDPDEFADRWAELVCRAEIVRVGQSAGFHISDDADEAQEIAVQPWPEPIAGEALQGIVGDVVRAIDPQTEADPVAVLAQFLAAFGSACGRTGYRPVGVRRHYPNLFMVLVGASSRGRKGTAWDWVENLFKEADPNWSATCIQAGLSSGEGLIQAVRDARHGKQKVKSQENPFVEEEVCLDPGSEDKRLLVVEEEFGSTLRVMARDGNILSAVMRQAWDGGRLRTLTKVNPLRATDAHVSVLGHITRPELCRLLSETDHANGFANRIIWLASRRSKLLPDGGNRPDGWNWLVAELRKALDSARQTDKLERSDDAARLWREWYPRLTAERPGAYGLVTSRAEAQTLRLSVIYAMLDGSPCIEEWHLRAALALWKYSENSCRWIFGTSTGSSDADAILEALQACGSSGMTSTEINGLFSRNRSKAALNEAMALLESGGMVRQERVEGKGRPAVRWYAALDGYERNELTN